MSSRLKRVVNYDDVKGYIQDERYERIILAGTPYLVDPAFDIINSTNVYQVVDDDGIKSVVHARKVSDRSELERLNHYNDIRMRHLQVSLI